jgi:hypothetical protein
MTEDRCLEFLTWVEDGLGSIQEKTQRVETFGLTTTKCDAEYSGRTAIVSGTWWNHTDVDLAGQLLDTGTKNVHPRSHVEDQPLRPRPIVDPARVSVEG